MSDCLHVPEAADEDWFCSYCGCELFVAEDTFDGLLSVARRILAKHYPPDIFPPAHRDTRDPGVQLIAALRAVDAVRGGDAL